MAQTTQSRPAKWALGALAVAGVGLSAFWVAKATTIWFNPESEWVAPLPVQSASISQRTLPAMDTRFDAFHRDATPVEASPVSIGEDAPETTLNLTLKGHRAGPNGSATILTPDRKQAPYYIGDEIIPGVTLEAVNPGFAVIRRSTGLERLSNKREELFGGQPDTTNAAIVPAASTRTNVRDPLAQRRAQGSGSGNTNPLARISAGDLLRNITLDRVMDGDKVKGYSVSARGGMDLSAFGLRPGDIVTHVNGDDLTQGRPDLAELMEDMSSRNDAQIIVLRNGTPVTVRIGN